jgi:hypothetical protein
VTGRDAIAGVEGRWASDAALSPCAHCSDVHPADWIHIPAHCRKPPRRRAARTNGARPADDLGAVILAVLAERGPLSGRRVQASVPRRQVDVRAALRELAAAGYVRRGDRGWETAR